MSKVGDKAKAYGRPSVMRAYADFAECHRLMMTLPAGAAVHDRSPPYLTRG